MKVPRFFIANPEGEYFVRLEKVSPYLTNFYWWKAEEAISFEDEVTAKLVIWHFDFPRGSSVVSIEIEETLIKEMTRESIPHIRL